MTTVLPSLLSVSEISNRLKEIFPETLPNRNYCVRELAASTIFAFIYTGAVEGKGIYLSPKHVYRMTEEQARKSSDNERLDYHVKTLTPGFRIAGVPWYNDTTRESIRDETLKEGFVAFGAVGVDPSIPTTSSKPRYYLKQSFASLFSPLLDQQSLSAEITKWQKQYLSTSALAMLAILKEDAHDENARIMITLPNGEVRAMSGGPSASITKAVIEEFAPRFLKKPFLLWLSESGNKMGDKEKLMANTLGLNIDPSKLLPDIILVELDGGPLIIFVEVVATDGPVTESRKSALSDIVTDAGYEFSQAIFVTAYRDRQSAAFRKTSGILAWNSYAWFQAEPDGIWILRQGPFRIERM